MKNQEDLTANLSFLSWIAAHSETINDLCIAWRLNSTEHLKHIHPRQMMKAP